MASENTLKIRNMFSHYVWRKSEPRETVARDRSLNGKARIRARRADQRAARRG